MAAMDRISDAELQRLVEMCFTCLQADKTASVEFTSYCSSLDAIRNLFKTYLRDITIAKGVFEMIDATDPPTINDWMNLPSAGSKDDYNKDWVIYFLLLTKDGHRPKVYCRSATDGRSGMRARMKKYDSLTTLSMGVQKAIEAGYHIAYKGIVLRSTPFDNLSHAEARLCMLTLEASFCYVLSTMTSRLSMAHLSPWSPDAFTYYGLCSHTAFWDGQYLGDLPLTAEERQRKVDKTRASKLTSEKKRREKIRADPLKSAALAKLKKDYRQKLKADPLKTAALAKLKKDSRGKLKADSLKAVAQAKAKKRYRAKLKANPTACKQANKKKRESENKLAEQREGQFVCEICGHATNRSFNLTTHVKEMHGDGHPCGTCGKIFRRLGRLTKHKATFNH